jgi:hypothetical protein
LAWSPTWKETKEILEKAINAENFSIKADMIKLYKALDEVENISTSAKGFVEYNGPVVLRELDEENHAGYIFIGTFGINEYGGSIIVIPLFILEYSEEEGSEPMAMLLIPMMQGD